MEYSNFVLSPLSLTTRFTTVMQSVFQTILSVATVFIPAAVTPSGVEIQAFAKKAYTVKHGASYIDIARAHYLPLTTLRERHRRGNTEVLRFYLLHSGNGI